MSDDRGRRLECYQVTPLAMQWVGWLYQDANGVLWVSPQDSPVDCVRLFQAKLPYPTCIEHGVVKTRCAGQYHADGKVRHGCLK